MPDQPRLDDLAREVYRLRALRPRVDDAEAASALGVPGQEVSARQRLLRDLHLLEQLSDGAWAVRSPDVAAEQVLAGDEEELTRLRQRRAETTAQLGLLTGDYLEARRLSSLSGHLEDLEGVDQVRLRIQDLAGLASKSIDTMAPGGRVPQASADAALPLDVAALDRGVRLRNLFQHPARTDPVTNGYLRRLVQSGAEVRTAPLLPTRLILYDGAAAVLPVRHVVSGVGAVVDPALRRPRHAHGHVRHVLGRGGCVQRCTRGRLGRHDRPTSSWPSCACMAAGKKDEVVAREIGLSVRSTRRIVAEVTDRLGARSRFRGRGAGHGPRLVDLGALDQGVRRRAGRHDGNPRGDACRRPRATGRTLDGDVGDGGGPVARHETAEKWSSVTPSTADTPRSTRLDDEDEGGPPPLADHGRLRGVHAAGRRLDAGERAW